MMNADQSGILSYKNILQTVAEMRRAQKEFFKTKDQKTLIECKRLEASVDMRLAEVGIKSPNQ